MRRTLLALLALVLAAPAWAQLSVSSNNVNQAATNPAATTFWNFRLTDGTNFYNGLSAGQLPAALVGGRLDVNLGAWPNTPLPRGIDGSLGPVSQGPANPFAAWNENLVSVGGRPLLLGQQLLRGSVPVAIASDQPAIAITGSVTDNQGAPNTTANAWPVVASLSPNTILPTGILGSIGKVDQGNPNVFAPWVTNLTQVNNRPVATGAGPTTPGTLRVVQTDDQGIVVGQLVSLNATDAVASVALSGKMGAHCVLYPGTLTGTLNLESSSNNQGNWISASPYFTNIAQRIASQAVTNPNPYVGMDPAQVFGVTHLRVRVNPYTSGTAYAQCFATNSISTFALAPTAGFTGITAFTAANPLALVSGGVIPATSAVQAFSMGNASPAATEQAQLIRNVPMPTTTIVTIKSAANASVTATLNAAGVGLFHYITFLRIARTCTTAITGSAVLDVTTTNLPGSLDYMTGNACVVGTTNIDVMQEYANPIRSSVTNTATTIVCPAIGATGICQITVGYYTGS